MTLIARKKLCKTHTSSRAARIIYFLCVECGWCAAPPNRPPSRQRNNATAETHSKLHSTQCGLFAVYLYDAMLRVCAVCAWEKDACDARTECWMAKMWNILSNEKEIFVWGRRGLCFFNNDNCASGLHYYCIFFCIYIVYFMKSFLWGYSCW